MSGWWRLASRVGLGLLLPVLGGCTAELKSLGPSGPPVIPAIGYARSAFLLDVDLGRGSITVRAPTLSGVPALRTEDYSLVGGDVAQLTTSNFSASAVGAFSPGKVRVTFDIAITNRLSGLQLAAPTTFPAAPAGATGPLLFPFDIAVAVTTGGIINGSNDVVIVLPSQGLVAASPDWDGPPHNFFNDDSTCVGATDCFRWEEFPVIAPVSGSPTRRVGFDLDPSVGQFTARLIVAADLLDLGPPLLGDLQGIVSAATLGSLGGVTLDLQPLGLTTLTSGTGTFSFQGLPAGTYTLTVAAGLPGTCATPLPQTVVVQGGLTSVANLSLNCTVPSLSGTVQGTVLSSLGTPLSGVFVTATPTGLPAQPGQATGASGSYSLAQVPVGDGTGLLALTGLPANCGDPGQLPYAGLTAGGVLTVNIVVPCP